METTRAKHLNARPLITRCAAYSIYFRRKCPYLLSELQRVSSFGKYLDQHSRPEMDITFRVTRNEGYQGNR